MATYINLDDDKNNQSKDLTNKFIEKEIEKINKTKNLNSYKHSASEEAFKAAQLEATIKDTSFKELKEKILKDQQEESLKLASMIPPIHFIPSKKADKQPVINITNPVVLPKPKKSWHENFFWRSVIVLAEGLLLAYLVNKCGWN
jgi:hypothetical protein